METVDGEDPAAVDVPRHVRTDLLTQDYRAGVERREIVLGFALDRAGKLSPSEGREESFPGQETHHAIPSTFGLDGPRRRFASSRSASPDPAVRRA